MMKFGMFWLFGRYAGCCADALQKAVAARVAALPEAIYCTLTPEAGDVAISVLSPG